MKKIVTFFLSYTLFVFAVVFCTGFFSSSVQEIPSALKISYRLSNGFCFLLRLLPSICMTGFLLACSVTFSNSFKKTSVRFSVDLVLVFKQMIFVAIFLTFLISLCTLVFLPYATRAQSQIKNLPFLFEEYLALAERYANLGEGEHAMRYIERAYSIDKQNEKLLDVFKKAEIAKREDESVRQLLKAKSYAQTNLNSKEKVFDFFEENKMSAKQMLEKSQKCFMERDYFGAHYFAQNAKKLCTQNDAEKKEAEDLEKAAWEKIPSVQMDSDSEGNIFFRKKLEGYAALSNGKEVEAYYSFFNLSQENARKERDADVIRYLQIAQKKLLKKYFFIDETYDVATFENVGNIYFSLPRPGGNYDIVLIRGITEIEGAGDLVRYLHGLQIYSFDAKGNFLHLMKTPFAKMSAVNIEDISEEAQKMYLFSVDAKTVPELKLCALDRSSPKEKYEPLYFFAENDGLRAEHFENDNFLIYWPMPYKNFSLIVRLFHKQGTLNPFSYSSLAKNARDYGYPIETFTFSSLNKIFYPFIVLILLIFISIIAWNYRLEKDAIFKFKWIFILPIFNTVFYFASQIIEYIVKISNFVFIVATGTNMAFFAGIAFYVILLVAAIATFLARKGD